MADTPNTQNQNKILACSMIAASSTVKCLISAIVTRHCLHRVGGVTWGGDENQKSILL